MINFLSDILHKVAALALASVAVIGGLVVPNKTINVPGSEVASEVALPSVTLELPQPPAPTFSPELLAVIQGLEPATTDTGPHLDIVRFKVLPFPKEKIVALKFTPTSTSGPAPKTPPPPTPKPAPAPMVIRTVTAPKTSTPLPAVPSIVTAQWILDNAAVSLKQRFNGTFAVSFDVENPSIHWDVMSTLLGGGSVPQFNVSSVCDPQPDTAAPGELDQSPRFKVRSSYACTVSLTALGGPDRQTRTKRFPFTTGPGQMTVMLSRSTDRVLKDGINRSGFLFSNYDSGPVTVTRLFIDVSWNGLNTYDTPLILRFINSATDKTLYDYHLESLPEDPASPGVHRVKGAEIPLSFDVNAMNERSLLVQVLGVKKLSVLGSRPSVNVSLKNVTTNQTDVRTVLQQINITWACTVPTVMYNPLDPDQIFTSGEACRE